MLVSHGHLDHVGGAKLLQERFGARVLLTAADWDLLERDNPPWKPRRDMEIADGQKLTLGDTTLTMYFTPGHTNGTVSTLIPLRDGAEPPRRRRSGAARCSISDPTPRASRPTPDSAR